MRHIAKSEIMYNSAKQLHQSPQEMKKEDAVAKDVAHELNELCRLYHNQRKMCHSSHAADQNQRTIGQSVWAMPAPVRFIRKTSPESLNRAANSRGGTVCPRESPAQSAQQTSAAHIVDPFDSLFEKLMDFDGADGCRSEPGSLDAQLNEAR